jgi:hypothetical protein
MVQKKKKKKKSKLYHLLVIIDLYGYVIQGDTMNIFIIQGII